MSNPVPETGEPSESEPRMPARLAWERARLEEAEADIAAGRVLSGQAAIDWLDRWAAGENLEEPPAT
jgi:hypothetical protein